MGQKLQVKSFENTSLVLLRNDINTFTATLPIENYRVFDVSIANRTQVNWTAMIIYWAIP